MFEKIMKDKKLDIDIEKWYKQYKFENNKFVYKNKIFSFEKILFNQSFSVHIDLTHGALDKQKACRNTGLHESVEHKIYQNSCSD